MFLDCEQLKQKTGGEIDSLKFRFNLNLSPLYSSGFSLRIMTPTIGLGPTFMLGPPVFYLISATKKKEMKFFYPYKLSSKALFMAEMYLTD